MSRPKHQVKELEALLTEAEGKGWRVDKKAAYFRLRCPCGKHMTWGTSDAIEPEVRAGEATEASGHRMLVKEARR